MTSLKGDLRSIMGTPFGGVGHAVLIFSRVTRAAFNSDSVVLQLHDRIEMPEEADGKFRVDGLDPGPIRIELEGGTVHNHGWNIDLPDEGVWSLTDLVDAQVDWSPAVIGRAEAAARESRDHADRAEAGADRVGTAEQVGVWASEASSSASDASSARYGALTARNAAQSASEEAEGYASSAATSESNAKTSETNAKQSEDNAGDYAAVATTAATEAVDAMERATDLAGGDFATHEYVDSAAANVPRVDTTVGARVFVGNQMIFGDTGLRRLARWDSQGVDIPDMLKDFEPSEENLTSNPGGIWIRRQNNTVTLYAAYAKALKDNPEMRPSPVGFGGQAYTGFPFPAAPLGYSLGGALAFSTIEIGLGFFRFRIPKDAAIRTVGTGGYGVEISWHTRENWPTSLPGTPA